MAVAWIFHFVWWNSKKKTVIGQILFSDVTLTEITNYIEKKFGISVTRKVITRVAKTILSDINYINRFSRGVPPEKIPKMILEYKQGASSSELAKKYDLSFHAILRCLKKHRVPTHGYGDLNKTKITPPQEFTPNLAKFIALIMTERLSWQARSLY